MRSFANSLFVMTINQLPASLDDLTIFLAVKRAGGFREAAKRMRTSPSTVSETISRLEGRLGVRLFTRTTRSVMPTEAGRSLARRIEPLLAEVSIAINDVLSSERELRGSLKLNVPGAVMTDILPPLVDRFLEQYQAIKLEIIVDDRLVDATAAGCDAGIRYGENLAQDMIAVPIGPRAQQGAVAASPAYIARYGYPYHPRDLLDHGCIRNRFASGVLTPWELEKNGEAITVEPEAKLIISTSAAVTAIEHAVSGLGLIYTFRNWLDPYFEDQRLLPVLQDWWPEFEGPWLYFSNRFMPTLLRAFVDFVAEDQRAHLSERHMKKADT